VRGEVVENGTTSDVGNREPRIDVGNDSLRESL
jgi:hypothetical protein